MGLILDGHAEEVPGLVVRSWRDDPRLRLGAPGRRPRGTRWVRSILFHLSQGAAPKVRPGGGPAPRGDWSASVRERRPAFTSCHATILCDGSVASCADAIDEITYHSSSLNEVSIGIELEQPCPGELWEEQLESALRLADFLTARLGIQRQFHAGEPPGHPVPRLFAGGRDCVGIFTSAGSDAEPDAGALFERLASAGYERWDFRGDEDLVVWRERQSSLNERRLARLVVDGIPGPSTARALRGAGSPAGMWIRRPGDDEA